MSQYVSCTAGEMAVFGKEENALVIKMEGEQLHLINKVLCDNLEVTDTFPTYRPHMTLCYVRPSVAKVFKGSHFFAGEPFVFHWVRFTDSEGNKANIQLGETHVEVQY